MTYFSAEQVGILLKPIHPRRVSNLRGMSYVEGYDVKAELNRVFGFGRWDTQILGQSLICERQVKTSKGDDAWYVAYRTSLRLTVRAPDGTEICHFEESHAGNSTHPDQGEAHGNAITNSWTYALKRCATNLGDQFGLSLYGKGSREALVRWTLVPGQAAEAVGVDDDDVPQVTPEAETPAADSPEPARSQPAPVNGNGQAHSTPANGTVARPPARGRPEPASDRDPDAQVFADEASVALTLDVLKAIHERATKAGKMAAVVASPSTGALGVLGVFIEWKRKQIRAIDDAYALLVRAANARKMPIEDMETHVKRVTGKSVEEASAAEIKQATEALTAKAAA
jgi:hypothetical protein